MKYVFCFCEQSLHGYSAGLLDLRGKRPQNTLTNFVYKLNRYSQILKLEMSKYKHIKIKSLWFR